MEEYKDLFIRIFSGFIVLFILTRILGKKQIGQFNIFTYITGIAIGNMAGELMIHPDVKIINAIIAMSTWALLIILMEIVSLKSGTIRTILDGQATIVIKKGQIKYKALKKARLNMDDLLMLLRARDIFYIKDVDYAILEPNGELSVLKTPEKQIVLKQDINIKVKPIPHIPTEIIVDGKILDKNLREINKTKEWVYDEVRKNNISNIKKILYAELQEDDTLYINMK